MGNWSDDEQRHHRQRHGRPAEENRPKRGNDHHSRKQRRNVRQSDPAADRGDMVGGRQCRSSCETNQRHYREQANRIAANSQVHLPKQGRNARHLVSCFFVDADAIHSDGRFDIAWLENLHSKRRWGDRTALQGMYLFRDLDRDRNPIAGMPALS